MESTKDLLTSLKIKINIKWMIWKRRQKCDMETFYFTVTTGNMSPSVILVSSVGF
jgi:hypothetical protein